MKYKEALKRSLNKNNLVFPGFVKAMAVVQLAVIYEALKTDTYSIEIGGEKQSGKAIEDPGALDCLGVLTGQQIMRGIDHAIHLQEFLEWLKDEEISEDAGVLWWDFQALGEKWNEFAEKHNVD